VFFNANSFAIGEKAEIFWSMRAFEIAHECGVKIFQYSGLDYALKRGGYDPKFRCAHLDGKGRVVEWINEQSLSPMKWSILTTGPYMEQMHFMLLPKLKAEPTSGEPQFLFEVPLGDGAIPMIHLDDLGEYARWIFDHPEQSAGIELKVATQHVGFKEVAEAFNRVTGKNATYVDVPLKEWLEAHLPDTSSAYQVDAKEAGALTWRESFTGYWNTWRHSGGAKPLITRDYAMLDKILPNRVRSIEEWMRKVKYKGEAVPGVLKDRVDRHLV